MPKLTFKYGDYEYVYHLIKEDRKTLRLTVYPNLNIVLFAPLNYPSTKIESFLKRKCNWITKQTNNLSKLKRSLREKEYVSGESFLYLGRQYKLVVKKSHKNHISFESGRMTLNTTEHSNNSSINKAILEQWYLKRAESIFKKRYKEMFKKFNYDFVPELAIRKMEKRWGSFLAKKKILLNPELIKAPTECIDFVIIHELCHMKYKNHSENYYRFLSSKCPNWKILKEKLELRFSGN
jgi:hypothetical protein